MVIVLISARYKKILELMIEQGHQEIKTIHIIKQIGGKVFLYIDTGLSQDKVIRHFHSLVQKYFHGAIVYEFYGIYNGKIDFHPYLSNESKNEMKYYQINIKDITKEEIEQYI